MNASRRRRGRRRGGKGGGDKQGQGQQGQNQQGQGGGRAPREPHVPHVPHVPKTYAVVFYETHADAKANAELLAAKAQEVGQLNIVIRSEGEMDDPDLTKFGKVFAGAAWTLIHERRVEEGWYESPH